jgi:Zn-dependent peptidase ImmA (M78 family)
MIHAGEIRHELCMRKAREALNDACKGQTALKPPVNVERIAFSLGFQVILLETVGDEFSGLVSIRQKLIGINARHHRHRRRFTLGHEIAHVLLNHPPESHCSHKEIDRFNAEADACAAEILMPADLILSSSVNTIPGLAAAFDVSTEAMAVRLQQISRRLVAQSRGPIRITPVVH